LPAQRVLSPADSAETPVAVRAWTRLLRAQALTARLLSAELQREHGLSVNAYEALYLLDRADGRRMKRVDLARRLGLTPSGVTRLLEGLESAGLVERAACDADLRVTYAQLTSEGAARLKDASCGHVAAVCDLMESHLSESELEGLAETLAKLPGVADGDDACPAAD
jgi:DNA-binding MarR family transcriptional regulator